MKLRLLKKLTISQNITILENKVFYTVDNCLHSFRIPTTIKKINDIDFEFKELKSFTIPSNVTKLSDRCFSGFDNLTEIKGLEHVKEIGKGCFHYSPKLDKEEYPEVKNNNKEYLNELVKENHQKQLEEWTSLKCNEIVFDSEIDNWKEYTSVFNERIIGKKQLVFLIEDIDGEIFGYYLNNQIVEKYNYWQKTDYKSFLFNLQSKNNRLPQPMKFELKDLTVCGITMFEDRDNHLISFGNIELEKENTKKLSYCWQIEGLVDYHGIEKALCGKTATIYCGEKFIPKRILVIQMK